MYVCIYIYIYIYAHVYRRELRGSQGMGVVSNSWCDCALLLSLLHVRTLMLTIVQTPFLGTPLVPLKLPRVCRMPSIRKLRVRKLRISESKCLVNGNNNNVSSASSSFYYY